METDEPVDFNHQDRISLDKVFVCLCFHWPLKQQQQLKRVTISTVYF